MGYSGARVDSTGYSGSHYLARRVSDPDQLLLPRRIDHLCEPGGFSLEQPAGYGENGGYIYTPEFLGVSRSYVCSFGLDLIFMVLIENSGINFYGCHSRRLATFSRGMSSVCLDRRLWNDTPTCSSFSFSPA